MKKEIKNTAYYISLLKSFPPYKKGNKRKPYLKIKHLGNQKVFFEIFIQKITSNRYNKRDKLRRLQYISNLPMIFSNAKPIYKNNRYIFFHKDTQVIVKKYNNGSLHLLTFYPR